MHAVASAWRTLPKQRAFTPRNTWVHALLHCRGRTQSVVIRDVSLGGMKLEFAFGLVPGDEVEVELTSARKLQGTIAFSVAAYCGVAFPTPLAEDDPLLDVCKGR